jgi:hypothetical protein
MWRANAVRSKWNPEKQSSSEDEKSTVAPLDANFVLAGMDKHFSLTPSMRNLSPLDPSMRQDHRRWSSIDLGLDSTKDEHPAFHFSNDSSFVTQVAHSQGSRRAQRPAPGLSSAQQTQISPPSDVSMDAAPRETIPRSPLSSMDCGLSNAPQTKAEQQRMAQRQSVTVASPSGSTRIEHILSMLHQANESARCVKKSAGNVRPNSKTQCDPDTVILTKHDALEILEFIKQTSGTAQATSPRVGKGHGPSRRVCPRDGCRYTVSRDCDLRKHMKRHDKPYGCTYPKCHKRFGAKSDWKRHENSQHFQPEVFRCAYETSPGAICGAYAPHQPAYEIHLQAHGLSSLQDPKYIIECSKIGKNCQGSFWCGFCVAILALKTKRNAAWDERFNHIAHHLEKEKKSIEEWVCVEQNKTKKELHNERMQDACEDDEEREKEDGFECIGEERDCDDPLPPPPPPPPPEHVSWTPISIGAAVPHPPHPSFGHEGNRKRSAATFVDDLDQRSKPKRRRTGTMTNRYCVCILRNMFMFCT